MRLGFSISTKYYYPEAEPVITIENIRIRMLKETASLFEENSSGHYPEIFLKLFKNIKENQLFYKTYFKLGYDGNYYYI